MKCDHAVQLCTCCICGVLFTTVVADFGQANFAQSIFGQANPFFLTCCCQCCCLCVVVVCWFGCWVLVLVWLFWTLRFHPCAKPPCRPPCAGPPWTPPAGPPNAGPPKMSLFFPSPAPISFFLFSSLGVFSLNFGVFEGRSPQMCTFGLSDCRVKPRRGFT